MHVYNVRTKFVDVCSWKRRDLNLNVFCMECNGLNNISSTIHYVFVFFYLFQLNDLLFYIQLYDFW